MTGGIVVRRSTSADAETIVRFNMAMAVETEGIALKREVIAAGVRAMFDDPSKGFYLVAEVAGSPAGQLMVTMEWSDWRDGFFWWIQSVYVRPEFRGKGVYRALHQRVRQMAKEAGGVCGFRLYVEKENTTAQATYRRLGMHETRYLMFEEPSGAP